MDVVNYLPWKSHIRTIRHWPKPGINFRDVSTLFLVPGALGAIGRTLSERAFQNRATQIAAIDARGFVIGAIIASFCQLPLLLVRKKGKLPGSTISKSYSLEYGSAEIEIHQDALKKDDRVLLVDDLIATGGTLVAAVDLIQSTGALVVGITAIVDLPDLGGSRKLLQKGLEVTILCSFTEDE